MSQVDKIGLRRVLAEERALSELSEKKRCPSSLFDDDILRFSHGNTVGYQDLKANWLERGNACPSLLLWQRVTTCVACLENDSLCQSYLLPSNAIIIFSLSKKSAWKTKLLRKLADTGGF